MATIRTLVSIIVLAACALPAAAQDKADKADFKRQTANTFADSAEVPSPRATLETMKWFAGQWTGSGLGGSTEESWSAPAGGAMMGMFRLIKEGKPVFYEFLTLVEHEGSLMLRLKHFNPDLTGWEEKADSIKFRLLKIAADEIAFAGLTIRREGGNTLRMFLAIRDRTTGAIREEAFVMTRTPASN